MGIKTLLCHDFQKTKENFSDQEFYEKVREDSEGGTKKKKKSDILNFNYINGEAETSH